IAIGTSSTPRLLSRGHVRSPQHRGRSVGEVFDLGAVGCALHGFGALDGGCLGLVCLTSGHDLPVARFEPEVELSALLLVDLELGSPHACCHGLLAQCCTGREWARGLCRAPSNTAVTSSRPSRRFGRRVSHFLGHERPDDQTVPVAVPAGTAPLITPIIIDVARMRHSYRYERLLVWISDTRASQPPGSHWMPNSTGSMTPASRRSGRTRNRARTPTGPASPSSWTTRAVGTASWSPSSTDSAGTCARP